MPAFTLQPVPLTNPHATLTHTRNYLSCLTICYRTHTSKSIYFTVLFLLLLFFLSICCLSVLLTSGDKSSLPPVSWLNGKPLLRKSIESIGTFHRSQIYNLKTFIMPPGIKFNTNLITTIKSPKSVTSSLFLMTHS